MSDRRLRVFVSSSSGRLGEEREAASAVIRTLRLVPVFDEAGPEGCDVFVGIYWHSYGRRLEGGVSRLEEEYTRGRALPRFLYAKEPAPERETPLERLLARMTAEERVRSFQRPASSPSSLSTTWLRYSAGAFTATARRSRTSPRERSRFSSSTSTVRRRSSGSWETPTQPSSMRSVSSSRSRRAGTQELSPISMATAPSPRSPFPPRPRGRRSTSSASSRAPPGRRT